MAFTAFLTDATICIGCKACEVACKEWNEVPEDGLVLSGFSYDNTQALGASTWRHVLFLEQPEVAGPQAADTKDPFRWVFLSDVCKHCANAGCLESCPTGAIVRTEVGSVFVQPDVCNGCGYCVVSCPFGVIDKRPEDGRAFKCTFCYDRQKAGLVPACAKACPTAARPRISRRASLRSARNQRRRNPRVLCDFGRTRSVQSAAGATGADRSFEECVDLGAHFSRRSFCDHLRCICCLILR
jgi:Fe-S-cluster-containing dehydrogenase component